MSKRQRKAIVQRKVRTAVKLDIQLRIQRYIEWSVTLKRKLSKFRI